jgi:4-amino-4-deoxy-L-arabinose transferase-like glycosyltransferase
VAVRELTGAILTFPLPALPRWVRSTIVWGAWILVLWVVLFWRLGYPSFWDPDEAWYAAATTEMVNRGEWLAPFYNGVPFFDKPILFYWLQMIAFAVFGQTELAARIVPAVSAMLLFGGTAFFGARLFDARTGRLGALMLALLPATFALSSYAILDMTFTAFLFCGLALVISAALDARPALQYPGYVLVGLAVLTKGPLAFALAGLAFAITLGIAPAARRPLLSLRWMLGLAIAVAISAPWFVYMWWRFGDRFIDGYFLQENLRLYSQQRFASTASRLFYLRLTAVGLLPWTPLLVGRIVDIARGSPCRTTERMLWAWSIAVVGFFTLSHTRYDHYIYPVAPSLCLLAANEWSRLQTVPSLSRHWGAVVGAALVPIVTIAAGVAMGVLISRVPLDLSPLVLFAPAAFIAAGFALLAQLWRNGFRPPFPLPLAGALLVAYGLTLMIVLPRFEDAKPVKRLAREIAARSTQPDSVATYHMQRWNPSWHFYVRQTVRLLDTPTDVEQFMSEPANRFCLMLRSDYDDLTAQGIAMTIVSERPGLFVTSGRALRRDRRDAWRSFVVVSNGRPSP